MDAAGSLKTVAAIGGDVETDNVPLLQSAVTILVLVAKLYLVHDLVSGK